MSDDPRDGSTRIMAVDSTPPGPAATTAPPPASTPGAGQATLLHGIRQRDKLLIAASVVAGTVMTVALCSRLGGHAVVVRPGPEVYTPQFDVGMGSQEVIRSFTSKTSQEVTELGRQINDLAKTMEGLIKRQDHTEQFVKDTLDLATAAFSRSSADKLKQIEDYAKSDHARHLDGRTQRIVDDFRRELTELKESPTQIQDHAAALLRSAGMPDDQVRNLLAQAAQEAGRVTVGDIAEEPASEHEIAALASWVRPYLSGIKQRLAIEALTAGRFYPEQTWPQIRDLLQSKEHTRKAIITEELCRSIAEVERVRRENLTQEIMETIPVLLSLRDQRHIDRNDRIAVAGLVWNARNHLPASTTAGQLLSLAHIVARSVGAVSAPDAVDAGFQPLDARTTPYAQAVIASAVVTARQLGKDQAGQHAVAQQALGNYLDAMRLTASAQQSAQIISTAIASAGAVAPRTSGADPHGSVNPGGAPLRAPDAGKDRSDASHHGDPSDNQLFFGPLRLERAGVATALLYALPGIMRVNGIDAHLPAGAAAMVAAMEQIPRIVSRVLPPYLGKALGGRFFLQDAIPQLIYAMRMGESLSGIHLPVSPGGTNEHSAAAALVRAAAIGAIYGPMIHDEQQAKSAAGPGIAQIEAHPPLRDAVVAALAVIPADQPLTSVIIAAQAVRPGRFPISARRFQEVADGMQQSLGRLPAIVGAVRPLLSEDQQGLFEENVRMLLPIAVACHDDGQLAVSELMAMVDGDLAAYSELFLAEGLVSRRCMEEFIPRYAPAMIDEQGAAPALIEQAMGIVPDVVYQAYLMHKTPWSMDHLDERARALGEEAMPLAERALVEQVVLSRVQPRIRRAGVLCDSDTVASSQGHARTRVHQLVAPPYTPVRIDAWATTVTDECRTILAGGAAASQPGGDQRSGPQRMAKGYWPAMTMLQGASANQRMVGASPGMLAHQLIIPAETFANAHLLSGVDAEIGGHGNIPVMLQIDVDWIAPGSGRIIMRGCRVSGSANVMAGPQRVSIDLKQLSYVFPDGREINAEVKGYVADNIHGQYGVLGHYRWNTERVLPLALVAGSAQGASQALKGDSTTQIIGATSTTTIANPGAQLTQALYGGLAGGAGIMADYVKAVLTQIHPSVSVENGQRVSVVLLDAVPLQVPEYEFPTLSADAPGGFLP